MSHFKLEIPQDLWGSIILNLRKRGQGIKESGAFLLGPIDSKRVQAYICYDDLDSHSLDTGIIIFDSTGFTRPWDFCRANHMTVLADVHTHPGSGTSQSTTDKNNPMIVQKGHIALIVPHFAKGNQKDLCGVGMYQYLGDFKWNTIRNNAKGLKALKKWIAQKLQKIIIIG